MATRRSNGEGTTPIKRADGRWVISIRTTQTTTGKETRKYIYGRTRAEAVAKARTYRKQLETGILADTTNQTLHQWAEQWATHIAAQRVRPQTLRTYRGYLQRWAYTTPIANKPLTNIKPKDIEYLYQRMREAGMKESTVHHLHRILAICFKAAVTNDVLARNPLDRVPKPQPETFDPVVLSPTKARELIAALEDDEEWGLTHTINLALGLRQGERLGLCWDDLDVEAGVLRVERTIIMQTWKHGCAPAGKAPVCGRKTGNACPQRTGGGFIMGPPKNKAGTRIVPLPAPILTRLKTHRANQRALRLALGKDWVGAVDANGQSWDLVFTDSYGRLIRPNYDWKAWNQFTTSHGVEGMRVHDARHTAATVLLSMGVSPQVTMSIMGWSSPSMLGRYQHVLDEMRAEAAEKVAGALFG